jgi:hypothetical protein
MKLVGVVAAAAMAALFSASPANAQIKLWQVTSGTFTFDKGLLTAGKDVGKVMNFPIAMYIIEHPRGLVVFDTGNSANISGDGCVAYWGEGYCKGYSPKMARDDAIDKQLEKTGHKLSDVKYVVYSHFHLDHAGNLEMFKDATNVVQQAELQFAWWPDKFSRPEPRPYQGPPVAEGEAGEIGHDHPHRRRDLYQRQRGRHPARDRALLALGLFRQPRQAEGDARRQRRPALVQPRPGPVRRAPARQAVRIRGAPR